MTAFGVGTFALLVVSLPAGAANAPERSTPLPEKSEGVAAIAADQSRVYALWADKPLGHTAAVSEATGKLLWHTITAGGADLLAVGDGVVWSAQNTGSALVEQDATTGSILAVDQAPEGRSWEAIAASGSRVYALSDGARHQQVSVYVGSTLLRRMTTPVPSSSVCRESFGGGSLYLLCWGPPSNRLYRISKVTGHVLAARRMPAAIDGGAFFAYGNDSVYLSISASQPNTPPETVVRLDASTLRLLATSSTLELEGGIVFTDNRLVTIEGDYRSPPSSVLTLDPNTLSPGPPTQIQSVGYPELLTAGGGAAYVDQVVGYANDLKGPFEKLIRVALPSS